MDSFLADIRYAIRTLKANPGFTAVAVAALALGIGANTAIFTVVNAVLLEPLPYPEPQRIVKLGRLYANNGYGFSNSIPKFMAWRNNHVFESMALYGQAGPGLNLGTGDRPEQVKAIQVSDGYFKVFGVSPALGRTFTRSEDLPGGPKVAIVSYGLWQSRFGGDPGLIGRPIVLAGQPYTVIGILPKGFHPDTEADVWVALQADPNSANQGHYLNAAARLKPGVSVAAAQAEMKVVGEQFRKANPKWMDKNESVAVMPMRDAMVRDVRVALMVLLSAVAFVLLIACANVANLLLVRGAGRQREFAIRAAIGAGRWRVIRQLLTESVLLGGVGGVLGFLLGVWGVRALLVLVPGNIPRLTSPDGGLPVTPALDWRVAAFTIGISLLTGIVFGLFPAWHVSNPHLSTALNEASGRSGTGRRQNRARAVLVVSEMALALVLLIGAVLLIRTFTGLRAVNPGFDAHHLLTLETSLAGGNYSTTTQVANLVTLVTRRLESVPGVESAAATIMLPAIGGIDLPFNIEGKPPAKGSDYNGDEQWRSVSPHFFSTLKVPLMSGRAFNEGDTGKSAPVVIINEIMAKRYWPKENPVGQIITIGKGIGPQFADPPRQIVGVVGSVRETGLSDTESGTMYVPQTQVPEGLTALANSVIPLAWAIRTPMDPLRMRTAVEQAIHEVDSQLPIARERSMEQLLSETVARQNFNMLLLSIFAGVALLLASIGIYGLMSYSVEQRTQEIGIRLALGADRSDMLKMVLGSGFKLAAAGIVVGVAIAYAVTRLLKSLLYGVNAGDPLTFAVVTLTLLAVALVASYIPARRAAGIEPVEALRYQ
jgi:putative ABC transport system permease protein